MATVVLAPVLMPPGVLDLAV